MDPVSITIIGIIVSALVGAPAWFPYISRHIKGIPADKEGNGEETSIQKFFEAVWLSELTDGEIAKRLQKNISNSPIPKLVYKKAVIDINILNPDGDAKITFSFQGINCGKDPILGETKSVWFENESAGTKIIPARKLIGSCVIHLKRDYGNLKQFFCSFPKAIKPLSSFEYGYEYFVPKMFTNDHYWDQTIPNLTREIIITITHNKQKLFQSAHVSLESNSGITQVPDPDLEHTFLDGVLKLIWKKKFPNIGTKYTVHWDFRGEDLILTKKNSEN